MDARVVVVGLGGPGVIFASKVLAQTALALGEDVIGSETHGMSQRGGPVVSHLKVGRYHSPLVRKGTADVVLALDPVEAARHVAFVRPGGLCFVNSAASPSGDWEMGHELSAHLRHLGIAVFALDADRIALECGGPAAANVALLGFATAHPASPFPAEAVAATLERISPARFRALNLRAFEHGRAAIEDALKGAVFVGSTMSDER
jgi:indolepyruvate ferredoxin oxidoreductase beta subunit